MTKETIKNLPPKGGLGWGFPSFGGLRLVPLYFAPLQGYTEDAYRRIHKEVFGGVEAYYSPFVRLEHGEVRSKDMRDIRPEFNEGVPLIPQVIASGGEEFRLLLGKIMPLGYKQIDINMGCPFPLQTRHGRGAGILQHPDKVEEIAKEIELHHEIEFSVKMRLGLESADEWRNIIPILNKVKLSHITVHPRIATQQYKGEVNMEEFSAFFNESKHPIVYNGDIHTVEDIHTIVDNFGNVSLSNGKNDLSDDNIEQKKLAGIMIGRGLLARPGLAQEYLTGIKMSDQELIHKIKLMHSKLLEHYSKIIPGESQQLNKIRTFWDYLEPTIGHKPWKKLHKAGNIKNYLKAIDEI